FFAQRATGAAALLLLLPAGVLMTGAVSAQWVRDLRLLTLSGGVLAAAAVGWAWLGADVPAPSLHRTAVLHVVLVMATLAYATGLGRLVPAHPEWSAAGRVLAPTLGVLAVLSLLPLLGQELLLF